MSRAPESIVSAALDAGQDVYVVAAILAEFDRCRPWLEAAVERDTLHTIDEVEGELVAQRAQLWPGERSAVVTRLNDYPRGRAMECWLAGGDLDEIDEKQVPQIEAQARAWGCVEARIECGRKGWERVMRPHGYEFAGVVLRKDLGESRVG